MARAVVAVAAVVTTFAATATATTTTAATTRATATTPCAQIGFDFHDSLLEKHCVRFARDIVDTMSNEFLAAAAPLDVMPPPVVR
jgi:hypothetical protein